MRLLLLAALLGLYISSNAQRSIVFPATSNILYTGVSNALEIMLEGCPCEDLVVIPENGTLVVADCSRYMFQVDKSGDTYFRMACKTGNTRDTVYSGNFRVMHPPLPFAWIDNKPGGRISAKRLHESIGVGCTLRNFDFDVRYRIVGYEITLIRGKDGKPTTMSNDRDVFTKEIVELLSSAVAGDVLMVRNIKAKASGLDTSDIAPIVFEVE